MGQHTMWKLGQARFFIQFHVLTFDFIKLAKIRLCVTVKKFSILLGSLGDRGKKTNEENKNKREKEKQGRKVASEKNVTSGSSFGVLPLLPALPTRRRAPEAWPQ